MLYPIILISLNTYILLKIFKSTKVTLILKILLGVSYFGWNALPFFLSKVLDMDEFVLCPIPALYDFCNIANQIFLFFTYLIAYILINKKQTPLWINKYDFQYSPSFINRFTTISIWVTIISVLQRVYSTTLYTDFDVQATAADISTGPISFIFSIARFYLVSLLVLQFNEMSKKQRKLIIILLVLYFGILTIQGSRINIFAIVILLLYYSFATNKKKYMVYTSVIGVFALSLLPVLSSLRLSGSEITLSDIEKNRSLSSSSNVVNEILIKTNSADYSSFLLLKDGIGGAGAQVYTSTIYSLVPKFIYPSKPEVGSKDGTVMGSYARYAASIIADGAEESGYNVGVCSSIISLWTLGYPMYIIHIIISGFLIFIFNSIFDSKKSLYCLFILMTTNFPVCWMDVSLDVVLRDVQRYIILYFVLRMIFQYSQNKTKI